MKQSENIELLNNLHRCLQYRDLHRTAKVIKHPLKFFIPKSIYLLNKAINLTLSRKIKTFFGSYMTIIIPDYVSTLLYKYSFYEEDVTTFLLNFLGKGDIFIDIGSHIGYFSLLASKLVGEKGKVHNFEPTKTIYGLLTNNCLGKFNIKTNNNACWSSETELEFHDYGIGASVINSLYDPRGDKKMLSSIKPEKYPVKTVSIDEYTKKHGIIPNFIKIDAESSELEILKGMKETIDKYMPMISLEVGDMNIKNVSDSSILIKYLLDKGYSVYHYNNGKIEKHKIVAKYESSNLLFIKS